MNADPAPQDATVHIVCRYFASCQYQATGPADDVSTNYKQHLREQHHLAHPKVEPQELQASGALADFDRSPAVMAALDPFPRAPMCGGQVVIESVLPPSAVEAFRKDWHDTIAAATDVPPELLDSPAAPRSGIEFRAEYPADPPCTTVCQLEPGGEPRILDFQREGA